MKDVCHCGHEGSDHFALTSDEPDGFGMIGCALCACYRFRDSNYPDSINED